MKKLVKATIAIVVIFVVAMLVGQQASKSGPISATLESSSSVPNTASDPVCVKHGTGLGANGNVMEWNWDHVNCPVGTYGTTLPSGPKGATGATGATGAKGDTGSQGPSGVQQVGDVTGNATLPAIGGSWVHGHAAVKTINLKAGTYHVIVTGDFYKTATTTATPVLQIQLNGADHQLTGYTGEFPYDAAEATGVGSDGTPNGLEQTAVADGVVVLAADGTVEVDAFGYNPNRSGDGGGDFGVNVRVDIVQLTPAS